MEILVHRSGVEGWIGLLGQKEEEKYIEWNGACEREKKEELADKYKIQRMASAEKT